MPESQQLPLPATCATVRGEGIFLQLAKHGTTMPMLIALLVGDWD